MGIHIAIVAHSGSRHTLRVAGAIAEGAEKAGVTTTVVPADDPDWQVLDGADAIIFGCPTYMGTVSGQMKMFMDASARGWKARRWRNKIAAGFTSSSNASGDKLGTLQTLAVFAAQHGMVWVGLDLPVVRTLGDTTPEPMNRLGAWLGLAVQEPGAAADDTANTALAADLATASYFGERVAKAASRWVSGPGI